MSSTVIYTKEEEDKIAEMKEWQRKFDDIQQKMKENNMPSNPNDFPKVQPPSSPFREYYGDVFNGKINWSPYTVPPQKVADKIQKLTGFSPERYQKILDETYAELRKLAELKGGEYAGDVDRLANFRRNAGNLGLEQEQVWAVYAGKHWDALMQYIKDLGTKTVRNRLEPIGGRVDDLLVYLTLFKCMLDERGVK